MRTFILLLGFISGAVVGLALAHWLGFDLWNTSNPGAGAIAAATGGLGGGAGLALARGSHRARRKQG